MVLLTWDVSATVSAECPDFKPDPYTGEYPKTHCLVNYTETIQRHMKKTFKTREEAEEFIEKSPHQYNFEIHAL